MRICPVRKLLYDYVLPAPTLESARMILMTVCYVIFLHKQSNLRNSCHFGHQGVGLGQEVIALTMKSPDLQRWLQNTTKL